MKIFGIILIAFAVVQAYLWVFGVIDLDGAGKQSSYFFMIFLEFIAGLLATKLVKSL